MLVSYSRGGVEFADQLLLALIDKGFDGYLDRQNIDDAKDWKERLAALLARCDTVILVLTNASVRSAICDREVENARSSGKRIFPVVPKSLRGPYPTRSPVGAELQLLF